MLLTINKTVLPLPILAAVSLTSLLDFAAFSVEGRTQILAVLAHVPRIHKGEEKVVCCFGGFACGLVDFCSVWFFLCVVVSVCSFQHIHELRDPFLCAALIQVCMGIVKCD